MRFDMHNRLGAVSLPIMFQRNIEWFKAHESGIACHPPGLSRHGIGHRCTDIIYVKFQRFF